MNVQELVDEIQEVMYLMSKNPSLKHHKVDCNIKRHDMMFLKGIQKINQGDLVKMNEIHQYFHVSAPAISQMIRRYEEKNFVERVILDNDRRSVYIRLTPYVLKEMKKVDKAVNDEMTQFVNHIGEEDAITLIRIMRKMTTFNPESGEENV